jgi:hypothetical protein
MSMSVAFLVGRFLLAVPVVVLGLSDAREPDSSGATKVAALLGVLGAAGVVLGVWGDVAALVMAAGVVGTTMGRGTEAVLSGIGLAGGAVVVFAVYAGVGDALDLTFTDQVISLDLR